MTAVPVLVPRTSPRLQYVLDWLPFNITEQWYTICTNEAEIPEGTFFISYGKKLPGALSVPDTGLLWETGIAPQQVAQGTWNHLPTLFAADGDCTLPFDIFSAIFYLLSRYEEYLPYTPDRHGRYPATESILYQTGLLQRPIVDEWVYRLRKILQTDFGQAPFTNIFRFEPSYDIDIAWSYQNKGLLRNAGGLARDILKGDFPAAAKRIGVLAGNKKDPYDSFARLQVLHEQFNLRPYWFILAALKTTPFDKNISPRHPEMKALIYRLSRQGDMGLHPSYYSFDPHIFKAERMVMERITGREFISSRQHYIKMKFPDTCKLLLGQAGSWCDFSIGYGTHPGFRAGTGEAFYWYNFEAEKEEFMLQLNPFCFMDTTARYDCGMPVDEAFELLRKMAQSLKTCNGRLTTVFHNFSLGTDKEWSGWYEAYERFVQEVGMQSEPELSRKV